MGYQKRLKTKNISQANSHDNIAVIPVCWINQGPGASAPRLQWEPSHADAEGEARLAVPVGVMVGAFPPSFQESRICPL